MHYVVKSLHVWLACSRLAMYCRRMATPRQAVAEAVLFEMNRADRSRRWIAEQAGISRSTLDRKLKGEIDFNFTELFAIASALRVPPSQFTPDEFMTAGAAEVA